MLEGRHFLFPPSLSNARVVIGQVEIFGIRIAQAGFVAGLQCKPLEESLELRHGGVQSGLAQGFTRSFGLLLAQMPLE